jgi:hypothetical protein
VSLDLIDLLPTAWHKATLFYLDSAAFDIIGHLSARMGDPEPEELS